MPRNKVRIQFHQHLLSYFRQFCIGQQVFLNAIMQQVRRTKHLFRQHPECILRCLFLIIIRIFRVGDVFTHILRQQKPFLLIHHQYKVPATLHLRQGMILIIRPLQNLYQEALQ